MTKKEIVRQISERLSSEEFKLTQLMAKEIVQMTLDAIIETLLREKRIELRNFGVFAIKRRRPRKARNPLTEESVDVPAKNVVTFKPGKDMEKRVRDLTDVPLLKEELEELANAQANGAAKKRKTKSTARKKSAQPAQVE